ncbi:hypothetical protein [Pedobacter miscanthi]|uniref:Uncharacterized protein n=1 Tax=Pedobacter miscanthi TaxID=2259170 RepID=A0A366LD29_9SPHI|nr:hypothetical protein [Pedobacter miscanthi]RBQ11781.1 hypothetical protein DRW42_00450 [Pedobacter miscanthi]
MATLNHAIENQYGNTFHQSLITDHYIFYTDDGDGIIMFFRNDLKRGPFQGYRADELLIEVIFKGEWDWASEDMKFNISCILEADSEAG